MSPAALLPAALQASAVGMVWLVSSAIRSALVLGAAWLCVTALRRGSPAARHLVWTLSVVGALLVPLLDWALPTLLTLPSLPISITTWGPTPSAAGGIAGVVSSISAAAGGVLASATTLSEEPNGGQAWPVWGAAVWATGSLLVTLRTLRGHGAAWRLWRDAEPVQTGSWLTARNAAAARISLVRVVALGRSRSTETPMTIGLLRPRVLLPATADEWSADRLRAVLLHELGHVRRHDTLAQLGAQLLCALYWWNPLAWLAASRLRTERELACDDLVVGAGVRPSGYAADLLDLAHRMRTGTVVEGGAACMVGPSWTEARLRRILDPAASRRPLARWFRWVAPGAMLTISAGVSSAGTPSDTQETAPSTLEPSTATQAAPRAQPERFRSSLSFREPTMAESAPLGSDQPPLALALYPAPLDIAAVTAEVKRRLPDLQRCYEERLAEHPDLAGEVTIHWGIEPNGEVLEQCITLDSVGDPELRGCVNSLVQTSSFPSHAGGTADVSYPFVFRPAR